MKTLSLDAFISTAAITARTRRLHKMAIAIETNRAELRPSEHLTHNSWQHSAFYDELAFQLKAQNDFPKNFQIPSELPQEGETLSLLFQDICELAGFRPDFTPPLATL